MSIVLAVSAPSSHASLSWWQSALLLCPMAAAWAGALFSLRSPTLPAAWRVAHLATAAMLVASVVSGGVWLVTDDHANAVLRSDLVGAVMAVLVSFVGWVVVRYSGAYLNGDPNERRYIGRLMTTLTAVSAVTVANHVLALVVAWAATSLALHGLLTFYPDRPVALAVAHKKFILARLADAAMIGAAVSLWSWAGTGRIDRIADAAMQAAPLPMSARIGVALVAVAALLKCAQLPFHGWLIQVMEAPTPVSALLHAGVVNLGGFVLLRFAPLVDRAPETRILLGAVGATTAVVAALVMTTRVSVKVSLAWSTCAQMGFMVLQCGLGLWPMALLHLVAHSLYKAHAFLAAGGVVRQTQRRQLALRPQPDVRSWAAGFVVALASTAAVALVWHRLPLVTEPSAVLWLLIAIVALAIVPLLTASRPQDLPRLALAAAAVPVAYLALHEGVGRLVPHGPTPAKWALVVVGLAFVALFVLQSTCALAPRSPVARRMYPWVYGGLFLDEAFARLAFSLWPPPPPRQRTEFLPERTGVALKPAVGRPAVVKSHPLVPVDSGVLADSGLLAAGAIVKGGIV